MSRTHTSVILPRSSPERILSTAHTRDGIVKQLHLAAKASPASRESITHATL